jgi:glutaredoxin 3
MVIIYGNNRCDWCRKAKSLAKDYNLNFDWRNTDDDSIFEQLQSELPNTKTSIPQIWWNGKYIGGYEDFAAELTNTLGGFGEGPI